MTNTTKVLLIILGLAVVSCVMQERLKPAKSQEQIARENAQREAEQKREAAAYATAKVLRDAMRDPDSLRIESSGVSEDAELICVEYRSRNGFGGMNREFAVFYKGKAYGNDAAAWNKRCTKNLFDQTAVASKAIADQSAQAARR